MRNIFYVTPGEPDWHCHFSNSLLTIICLACQNCLLIHLLICPFKKDDIIIIVIIDDNLLILCWLYILQSNPSFPIAHSQWFQCNFASSGLTQQKGESGLWVILGTEVFVCNQGNQELGPLQTNLGRVRVRIVSNAFQTVQWHVATQPSQFLCHHPPPVKIKDEQMVFRRRVQLS